MVAKKKRRRGRRSGTAWRVLFGLNGPTKKAVRSEVKKGLARLFGPKTIASIAHDPATGKLVVKNVRIDKQTGAITIAKSAKKKAASKSSRASAPSKPSRSGQAQRRAASTPTVQQQPRQPRAKSLTERTDERRRPDGKFDGSAPAIDPRVRAAQEYRRIMRHVDGLNRQTDRDLGWDRET